MKITRQRRRSDLLVFLAGRGGEITRQTSLNRYCCLGRVLLGTLLLLGSPMSLDCCCCTISDKFGSLLLLGSPMISNDLAACGQAKLGGRGSRAQRGRRKARCRRGRSAGRGRILPASSSHLISFLLLLFFFLFFPFTLSLLIFLGKKKNLTAHLTLTGGNFDFQHAQLTHVNTEGLHRDPDSYKVVFGDFFIGFETIRTFMHECSISGT